MAPEIDIWRTAPLLIRQHGEDAGIVAAQRVDALWQREGYEGHAIWLRVKRACGASGGATANFLSRRARQGRVHQGT
jgi:hypothetical protein